MSRFIVIGGAGRTGRHVVDQLVDLGHQVTVASRKPGAARPGTETVAVDLARGIEPGLLDGVDGVVIAVETPLTPGGADAVMHRGVDAVGSGAAKTSTHVVLISQIYINRVDEHPEMADWIPAREAGEQALRDSGTPYTIIRPGWLTNEPASGARLEQGDTGDGQTSRELVAQACVAALLSDSAHGKTFELYDDRGTAPDWQASFAALTPDAG